MKLIENAWLSYRREVVPADAGPGRVKETRYAFYGGAMALFRSIMAILEPGAEPTAKDLAVMASIQNELHSFGAEVEAALKAGSN